jgi:hypothetical protein
LEKYGCSNSTNIFFVVHGWLEDIKISYAEPLIKNYLKFGGGCVVFMDYGLISKLDYLTMVTQFHEPLRDVLYKKLISTGNYSRIFIFGFSHGARLSQAAGFKITQDNGGVPQIKDMHLCDAAGPLFDECPSRRVDPRLSAKNTQCINTSNNLGSNIYDCKQNFRMGKCGWSQTGAKFAGV